MNKLEIFFLGALFGVILGMIASINAQSYTNYSYLLFEKDNSQSGQRIIKSINTKFGNNEPKVINKSQYCDYVIVFKNNRWKVIITD